jgi:hypothetical protein
MVRNAALPLQDSKEAVPVCQMLLVAAAAAMGA